MNSEIAELESQIKHLSEKLLLLRKEDKSESPVPDYSFETLTGSVSLKALFGDKTILFAIHNMGRSCPFCTLWADGLNGFLPHLESKYSVVLLSKDDPEYQRQFANSRDWRFRMASHGGGAYISEQSVAPDEDNYPGLVVYRLVDGKVYRKSSTVFGPGDMFCPLWHILELAGITEEETDIRYSYVLDAKPKGESCGCD